MYKYKTIQQPVTSSNPSLPPLYIETNRAPRGFVIQGTTENTHTRAKKISVSVTDMVLFPNWMELVAWCTWVDIELFCLYVCKNIHTYCPIVQIIWQQLRMMMQRLAAPLNHSKLLFIQQWYMFLLLFRCWDTYCLCMLSLEKKRSLEN